MRLFKKRDRAARNVKAFGFDLNEVGVTLEGIEIIAMIPGRCKKGGRCLYPASMLRRWGS